LQKRMRPSELKSTKGLFTILPDRDQSDQKSALEHHEDVRANRGQTRRPPGRFHLLGHGDEFSEPGTRQVSDVRDIPNAILARCFINQAEQLVADDLNIALIKDLLVRETSNRHIVHFVNVETTVG